MKKCVVDFQMPNRVPGILSYLLPIGSMYSIDANIGGILMVNVT